MLRPTICAALLAASATASADSGFMFGIGAGQMDYDLGIDQMDDTTTAWKVSVGYRFSPNFTTELAYLDGGEVHGNVGGAKLAVDGSNLQLSATGGWWLSENFGTYVRAAWNNYDVNVSASGPGGSVKLSDSQDAFGYGLGLQALWDRALWRLEYETSDVEGSDVKLISLNVGWQF